MRLAAAALFLAAPPPAYAADGGNRQLAMVQTSEPDGFSSLTGPQTAMVDIYFGNQRLGDTLVTYRPGSLTFDDPEDLVAMLPGLADRQAVLTALSAPQLPSNAYLVCTRGADRAICGRTTPPVAAVIFDQEHFRADLFVNPRFLAVSSVVQRKYLPQPAAGLSIVNGFGAVLSGSSSGSQNYNLQDRFILGDADRRLRADVAYASGFGVQADRLVVEVDRPEWRYSAGAFWAPGTDLIARRKMLGFGIETQIETRLDKDEVRGNPLIVFLNQKSRVDILRDGRVLSSRIYEAGNQNLDTSSLPDGSYEVALQIDEVGGVQREERRFFTKNARIAAVGQKVLFAYAGLLVDDTKPGFLSPTGTPYLQAGAARRFGPHFALDGTVTMTDHVAMAEIGGYLLLPQTQVRLAAIGSSNGDAGGLLQFDYHSPKGLNVDFDLRRIEVGKKLPVPGPGQPSSGPGSLYGPYLRDLPLAAESFNQLSGIVSYSLANAQLGVAFSWRKADGSPATYSIGPSMRWEFLRRDPFRLSLNGDLAFTDQGRSGFIGLSLRIVGGHTAFGASTGYRSDGRAAAGTGAVGTVNASWQGDNVAGAELSVGGAYDHDLTADTLSASARLRGNQLSLSGDVIKGVGGESRGTQYSLGMQTLMALKGGTIGFDGRNQTDGMIVVNVEGSRPGDRFDVFVNDGLVRTISSGQRLAFALPPYRQYDVRIRPAGGALLHYDGSARRVGLYPGNVAVLSWTAKPVAAMFGRLVTESGDPVAMASIAGTDGIGETDQNGYFQIEATGGSQLKVTLRNGRSCGAALPMTRDAKDYVPVGTLTCRDSNNGLRLSSASKP